MKGARGSILTGKKGKKREKKARKVKQKRDRETVTENTKE